MNSSTISRRMLVKSSVLGLLGASLPNIIYSKNIFEDELLLTDQTKPHDRYPAIRLEIASEVVGVSHFNLDKLKELVDQRPELAKANWDWGFGDWESAIGAASHVGRKDIAEYLIGKGAVPTIFTFAMLGDFNSVKSMIEFYPGIQKNFGPHGISLMHHAKLGLTTEGADKSKAQQLVEYLQKSGDADGKQYMAIEEKEKYIGDYKYGEGKDDGFSIKLNMQKLISLGNIGKNGGTILKTGVNEFTYKGAPSVIITFKEEAGKVISMTLQEPGLILTAIKI